MTWITSHLRKLSGTVAHRLSALMVGALALLIPSAAFASEGNVVLSFSGSDRNYLYVSLALGLLAIGFAVWISRRLKSVSPGDEKMQSVGLAIKEGAMAYLVRQVKTMSVFVLLLAIGLFFMYRQDAGPTNAAFIALSFVIGVGASYIAGYAGMNMAVQANMRTASSALTSYKKALEVAFRSGSVAGLVTVGMGLIGATAIFLLFGENAMKMLIGFGFGGSLAALFMRVGGGIFTKAADVGADLVGKVEAGIPEDDPRNPATIADNVGDNVGDCAGMAADIFESYEVTLVAAIVLGAATAAIFDQSTWMKLILFALMARGAGIVASIFGILAVKGSDDVNSDPLKPIGRGFAFSAGLAALFSLALAFFMMGGMSVIKKDPSLSLQTSQLTSREAIINRIVQTVSGAKAELTKDGKAPKIQQMQAHPSIKAMGLDSPYQKGLLNAAMQAQGPQQVEPNLRGFTKIDVTASPEKNPVLGYAVMSQMFMPQATQKWSTMADYIEELSKKKVYEIKQIVPPQGLSKVDTKVQRYLGPMTADELKNNLEAMKQQNIKIEGSPITHDIVFYSNPDGEVLMGIDGVSLVFLVQTQPVQYIQATIKEVEAFEKKADDYRKEIQTNPDAEMPEAPREQMIKVVGIEHKSVPWYGFFLCVAFGILMAFAFERLTDYYVSTHKKPVQEIANVSSAGPAPMIIQGFSLGLESSVFSVLAIVLALIMPMVIFPPSIYGSYILSFYGIALVGLGLLTTTGYILAMDTFGPISDNAQGVFEMSGAGHTNENASKAVQRLDAAGNTTKALTKGFAIATAVVAAVALFHSYVEETMLTGIGMRLEIPEIFLGLLIGGAAPFLFSAFSINAVGRASFELINEVRRQFRNDPGIMKGTSKPDYATCVAIVTKAAQKELLGPGILAIALPIAVAFGFSIGKPMTNIGGHAYNLTGAQALGGFLAGAILVGQLLAVLLANSGGMWDNAKKLIEDGLYGGKGTEAHKAGVVCDTVGDPFKDTAGPALNPLIKVMNLVALLLAPFVIQPRSNTSSIVITVVAVLFLALAFYWSKRGSLSDSLTEATSVDSCALKNGSSRTKPESTAEETLVSNGNRHQDE